MKSDAKSRPERKGVNDDNKKQKAKRTRADMPQIGVRLTVDQLTDLDRKAAESRGRYNRSDLIRRAVDQFLASEK